MYICKILIILLIRIFNFKKITMKKGILFIIVLCLISSSIFSQKNKRVTVKLSYINLPQKLIYDQIKTYSATVSCIGNVNPFVPAKSDLLALKSYDVNDLNPDMKIALTIGPLNPIKTEQQNYSTQTESNGVKSTITTYSFKYYANYAFAYQAVNTKNNYKLVNISDGGSNSSGNISFETSSFSTTKDLHAYWQKEGENLVNDAVKTYVQGRLSNCNNYMARTFDFIPTNENVTFFLLKKSDIDDEFNKNIEEVMNTIKVIPSNDDIKIYSGSLASKITYLLSLTDKYKKEDKKENVLYMSVNYDLAALYYSLDMLAEAQSTIDKISDMKVDDRYIKELSTQIKVESVKMNKHFLTTRHLDFNPVKDFRLGGLDFISNALNYNEIELKKYKEGAESTDMVSYFDGTTAKGKIIFDDDKGLILLYNREDINNPLTMKPTSAKQFSKKNIMYVSATINSAQGVVRQFFGTRYFSDKIRLVEILDSNFKGTGNFGIQTTLKINAPIHDFSNGFSLKKDLAEYVNDCPYVSEKAKKGEYVTLFRFTVEKMIDLCKDYDSNKN